MTWINDYQVWLTPTQSLSNAQKIVNFLFTNGKDWSKESISALIGNMRHESSINPNMYEYGYDWSADRGFGLVQWTPRSKYWNWALQNGYVESDLRNGDAQLARIDYETKNNIQWIAVDKINNLTFKEFRTNSRGLSLNELTEAFTWGYERPNAEAGAESMPDRQAFALRAFNELNWSTDTTDPDPEPEPEPEPDEPDDTAGGIDLAGFINDLNQLIKNMLTIDLYHMGSSEYYKNNYLRLMEQMGNTFKIKPNQNFFDSIQEKFKEFNSGYIPDEPDPDPDPDPEPDPDPDPEPDTMIKVFPVKIQNGINFWKRSNWGVGTLQRNMTYGVRSSGDNHFGYDIGGGGVNHNEYSITDGEVIKVGYANGSGNRVIIKNNDDDYYIQYSHMKSYAVNTGDQVKAGDLIGVMGNTGGNYAIHLDIKISTTPTGFYDFDTTINPEKYLEIDNDNKTSLQQP